MTPETMPDYWITRGEAARLWVVERTAKLLRVPMYLDWNKYYAKPRGSRRTETTDTGCASTSPTAK